MTPPRIVSAVKITSKMFLVWSSIEKRSFRQHHASGSGPPLMHADTTRKVLGCDAGAGPAREMTVLHYTSPHPTDKYCMERDFFDQRLEEARIVVLDPAMLRQAERAVRSFAGAIGAGREGSPIELRTASHGIERHELQPKRSHWIGRQ